jgi:RNA polymerase sigma-70 factor (ECF subfamily)
MQEQEIIQRCQKGDIEAFRLIYERYSQALLHTALKTLGNKEDAEDAVQTTFVKLHQGIRRFRFDSKFSTYLFRILFNVCFDRLRATRTKMEPLGMVNLSNQPKQDLRAELDNAIRRLPDQQRACFVLYAIEELPQRDIAEILNLSIGGVKANIHHAKKKLRSHLGDNAEGEQT